MSHTRQVVISSKVVAYTSQPVTFDRHSSTHEDLTGLRNKPQPRQTHQHLAVVYWQLVILLMELSIDNENCFSIVCVSGRFWQSWSHIGFVTGGRKGGCSPIRVHIHRMVFNFSIEPFLCQPINPT